MALHSLENTDFPPLLSGFTPSSAGWKLFVCDIGANSGFPSAFDWNDYFDDDDGALIVAQTNFPDISPKPGFKATDEETGRFAFISFHRSASWEDGVLNYRIALPEVIKTSDNRKCGVNMEIAAVLAAACLQMQVDWSWLLNKFVGHEGDWTIRTNVEVSRPVPHAAELGLYETSTDAACRFYDGCPKVGRFAGFEEPELIGVDA